MSREEIRTIFLFWFFWATYCCLSTILVAALITDWPKFLHSPYP
jgi:Trk-type K+ transport system membrane component